jgi:hypothetical protein
MALANTTQTLNGLFKEVYAKNLVNLIPDGVKLLTKIPFAKREATLGSLYHQPVILGHEHGVTFATGSDDAFALNQAVAGQIKDATVQGTQLVLRSVLGLAAASRSMGGDAKAFMQATKFLVGNMLRSVTKKLEIEMLYGQVGYATLDVQGPTNTIVIPDAEWAPGIWAGSENMPLDIRDSAGVHKYLRNVVSVDFATKTITVDGAAVTIAAGDVIWHGSSSGVVAQTAYGKEFPGIHRIVTNAGPLFGIDASQYSLFRGNEFDCATDPISFAKVQDAVTKAVEKGLDNDVMLIVNPFIWSDLINDQASSRVFDSSYSSAKHEDGSKEIVFHSQNGKIEVVPSMYCKQGYAYVISPDEFMRIGSTDVTFQRPGKEGEFFRDLDNAAGYELRCYCDQSLLCCSC